VFVDECSTNTSLTSLYAWSREEGGRTVVFHATRERT
jgi:hypothetical protein